MFDDMFFVDFAKQHADGRCAEGESFLASIRYALGFEVSVVFESYGFFIKNISSWFDPLGYFFFAGIE
ncbi:hypothetical protein A8D95_02010 [Burkholderia cenocepacia]|jgi:hypothetical protein|uniref:Uncharacterized protein n=1 Tax=Burkholderia cenocepacia TaxID=95486 RepID=A0A1V6KY69_9BURK|nr:hypothetical protein A2T82_32895 [Burkholderia cenocepacia]AOK36584.1 hypothetical protein WL90_20025 [Burkholderia cenocepacia]AQQ40834.1 hypothetical protein A8E75_17655 [Burkholderia cenocepacia]KVF55334.1 hypothetical protein WJ14_18785 [Burkholderia cenocepacia]KWF61603.1 hypothetical protein WL89_01305 [Burkholderia cenocepacia]